MRYTINVIALDGNHRDTLVRLDVPTDEQNQAIVAGAVYFKKGWWVDRSRVERGAVRLWLPPRIDVSDLDTANETDLEDVKIFGISNRCSSCGLSSLAVTAFEAAVRGRVVALAGPELDLATAVLRRADQLPEGLARLRRRMSKTQKRIYMSNSCPGCDALFGEIPLGNQYAMHAAPGNVDSRPMRLGEDVARRRHRQEHSLLTLAVVRGVPTRYLERRGASETRPHFWDSMADCHPEYFLIPPIEGSIIWACAVKSPETIKPFDVKLDYARDLLNAWLGSPPAESEANGRGSLFGDGSGPGWF